VQSPAVRAAGGVVGEAVGAELGDDDGEAVGVSVGPAVGGVAGPQPVVRSRTAPRAAMRGSRFFMPHNVLLIARLVSR
jgi:hypothetical protein